MPDKVLLIDEDSDFIEANCILLDASGFRVFTASSSDEGLLAVQKEKPDVVVLNLLMENADEGFAVARSIRNSNSNLPIIVLSSVTQDTGYSFKPEEHPDYFPVNCFIEKPVSPSVLELTIRSLLAEEGI